MAGRPHYAFTLVELMVVIGLIGFLAALAVPALGRAKDHSRLIICRSNQHNLVLGCLMYAEANNSKLPVDKQLYNPHEDLMASLACGAYIEEPKVYYCPSEREDDFKYCDENVKTGNIGYFYYSFSGRPTDRYLSSFFLKNLPWPRLLNDTMSGSTWVFSDSWFSNMPTAHQWYKKGVNYAVLDGSVHMVKESPRSAFK